jgi:hypothetical protein
MIDQATAGSFKNVSGPSVEFAPCSPFKGLLELQSGRSRIVLRF